MNIQHIETNQDWCNETTTYWFTVDGEQWAIADCNGDYDLLDEEGSAVVIEQYKIGIYEALEAEVNKLNGSV